ncbi:hypothetical protein SEA_BILLNYE_214 [Streptomyces phage BillNye]|uniref:Uncharacterized protein n=2 Tax=Wilnyevirus billnye TaxID=2560486 RepID=A0A2L1IW58_9CAUD|nr:hypothetical protein FDJ30_gp048 [Streptomyces phage BillNye]AVD99385.1 hypothetical protein SEA_BILLNYE_214 [Streptomyces phage BillNye]QBZ72467.1 hypothetical protein SEA_CIRCINUS_214 [Streptomyces phage Circinus]
MTKQDERTQAILELRRGSRAQPIPSKKKYRRKKKHRNKED